MNKDLLKVVTQMLGELGLSAGIFSLVEEDVTSLKSQDFILARKNNTGDYFLFVDILPTELNSVNRDLQTSLLSYLNYLITDVGKGQLKQLNGVQLLEVDKHFEKNTSLLLFTVRESNTREQLTEITEVEEDEYFFKKQVLLLPKNYLENLSNILNEPEHVGIIKYLQDFINNESDFKGFINALSKESAYKGCAQLFEKLPFLHLNTPSSKSNFLQNQIDCEIAKKTKTFSFTRNSTLQNRENPPEVILKNLNEVIEAVLIKDEEAEENIDLEKLLNSLQGYENNG